jgi:PmbA protein
MINLAEQLLEISRKSGASHAEVYQAKTLSYPVFFEANRLKQLESSQAEGIALRIWRENRPGLAVAYGQVQPELLVEKAIALSHLNEPETVEILPAKTAIYPPVGEKMAVENLVEIGKNTIEILRENYPEVICSGELECETETVSLINSQGLHCEYTDTSISYYFGVNWIRGEDFLEIYDGEYSRNKIDPERVIRSIFQRLEWAKNNVNPPLGKVPVLFTNNAAHLLWGTVSSALSGKRKLEGSSPWTELEGEKVISEQITLSQKPDQEPYSCPFDDEGNFTKDLALITGGKLEQFYTDLATARALKTEPTGNGFRPSLGRYPTPDLVNLIVAPGKGNLPDLISQIENGLLVDQMLGGVKDISGEFSINIDLGYRIEKGQVTGRVKDTMVAGNVYHALKEVVALGADNNWVDSCYTPSLIVDGLSVIGG